MRSPVTLANIAISVLLLAAATLILPPRGAGPAWSAQAQVSEIRILGNVVVNKKDVYLSDICDTDTLFGEWKTLAQSINIGDAPPAGSEKFVDPNQLRAYLAKLLDSRGVNADDVKLAVPDKIIVRRESVQISPEQVETIFRQFVADNSPWREQEFSVSRVHFSGLPVVPTGQMTWEVIPTTPRERFIGNVTANIEFFVNGEKVRTLGVTGRVEVFANVYLASRPLKQNEMITSADLKLQKVNITDSADRFALRPDQVENRRVIRAIGINRPVELKDLDKPLVLKRGDPVTIVYEQPGLQVTAKGQVSTDAGVGDTLSVVNTSSRKTIVCKVIDGQTVRAVQ